jgi:type II secretory pathway pseudopilin PulG
MAPHPTPVMVENNRMARLRRELRNPSMTTVFLIVLAVISIPLLMLVPSWISTTRGSIQERRSAEDLRDAALLSSDVIIPSQITPWMLNQVSRMENAGTPLEWNYTLFTAGPCSTTNLNQLPAGKYSEAIRTSCGDLFQVQTDYADACTSAASCDLPPEAYTRLASIRTNLMDAFSDAGFVLPYNIEEQQASH